MKLTLTRSLIFGILSLCLPALLPAQVIVDFEDVGATLPADSAFRGEDNAGGFTSAGTVFNNFFGTFDGGDFWLGNAYSNQTSWESGNFAEFASGNDTVLSQNADGSANVGIDGSDTWGVVFGDTAEFSAPVGFGFQSFNFHNTQTTADVIINGNGNGATAFTPADEFGFVINRLEEVVQADGSTADEVVASTERILLTEAGSPIEGWFEYDLAGTEVAGASKISFEFFSTDTNDFGVVTPTYFAVDNIELVAPLLGDVNLDGIVSFADISPFIAVVSSGAYQVEADVDLSGDVGFSDVSPFISILSGP